MAITGMVAALAAFVRAFPHRPPTGRGEKQEEAAVKKRPSSRLSKEASRIIAKPSGKISVTLLLLSAGILVARSFVPPLSLNAELTKKAFDAYNEGKYLVAIANAQQCVDKFKGEASRQESEVKERPPIGAVTREKREEILARGPLNDVCSSLYIIASSYERLRLTNDSLKYYIQATNFQFARTWDPKGWFWSPASASADRLEQIQGASRP